MNLQQAIDLLHEIRERFPHVGPILVPSNTQVRRDGAQGYIIGVYRYWLEFEPGCVLSSELEYREFLKMAQVFCR